MSHFPATRFNDRTSPQLKAAVQESTSNEVWAEIEAARQAVDERTARLKAMRLAKRG